MAHRFCLRLVCALAAVLSAPSALVHAQSAERAGEVAELRKAGLQYVADGVDWLSQGDPVIGNARLETDIVGEMALVMDDGSQLVMPSNSELVIDRFVYDPGSSTGEAVFSLGRGALRMISGRMPSDRYLLKTPVATIGVRGTDFTVELIPGSGLVVRVDDGAVEISPLGSSDQFTIRIGQTMICSETECRDLVAGDPVLRRASLGPPLPGGSQHADSQDPSRQQSGRAAPSDNVRVASIGAPDELSAASACPAYRIPDAVYKKIGLDPAEWPSVVDGITFYRHAVDGVRSRHYCPERIAVSENQTSFSVLGEASDGDTKVLYFVNTIPGQAVFQPGANLRAKEREDAAAYRAYIPHVLKDEPGHQVVTSDAAVKRTAAGDLLLQQQVHARGVYGDYQVTGMTLIRPVSGDRTALFAIPAVVTPDGSENALSAASIGRQLY